MENQNKIVRKICVKDTLMSFGVGDCLLIKDRQARYQTILMAKNRIEQNTDRRYLVTVKGIPEGTLVRRLA